MSDANVNPIAAVATPAKPANPWNIRNIHKAMIFGGMPPMGMNRKIKAPPRSLLTLSSDRPSAARNVDKATEEEKEEDEGKMSCEQQGTKKEKRNWNAESKEKVDVGEKKEIKEKSREEVYKEAYKDSCKKEREEEACKETTVEEDYFEEEKISEEENETNKDDGIDSRLRLAAAIDNCDWEIISEKSKSSSAGTTILVSKNGSSMSICSITSADCSGSIANLSLPKSLRPAGATGAIDGDSTIASEDCWSNFGGYGTGGSRVVCGIPGVDYVEHVVLPSDTLEGMCLFYKISATRLRQANQFSGNTLSLAPKRLVIPLSKNGLKTGAVRVQDRTTKEYKVAAFIAEYPETRDEEARR